MDESRIQSVLLSDTVPTNLLQREIESRRGYSP